MFWLFFVNPFRWALPVITHPDSFNYRLLCQIKFAVVQPILKTANNNSNYGISLSTAGINV